MYSGAVIFSFLYKPKVITVFTNSLNDPNSMSNDSIAGRHHASLRSTAIVPFSLRIRLATALSLSGTNMCVTNTGHVKLDKTILINKYLYRGHLIRYNLKVKLHLSFRHEGVGRQGKLNSTHSRYQNLCGGGKYFERWKEGLAQISLRKNNS
jgi:hypothetical protein